MDQAAPATRDLARLLLARAATQSERAAEEAHAAQSVFETLRSYRAKLVGIAGFQALLARALALATSEADWLEAVDGLEIGARLKAYRGLITSVPEP